MEEYINRIQNVINALQKVMIYSTCDNMNYMLGSIQELTRIQEDLQKHDSGKLNIVRPEGKNAKT